MDLNIWYKIIDDNIKPIKNFFDLHYHGDGVILDIGGNLGAFTDYALSKYPNVEIHIFEPASKFKNYLNNKYKNTSVIFVPFGLSDKNHTTYLKCDNENLGYNYIVEDSSCETISLITLDDYISDHIKNNISFIKIDTELFEPFVLNGMKNYIANTNNINLPIIIIEYNYIHSPYKVEQDQVFNWLFKYYHKFDYRSYDKTTDIVLIPLERLHINTK